MTAVAFCCERMTAATAPDARALLSAFLGDDEHYRASAAAYGDGGAPALARAVELFVARPELGFVWLAYAVENENGRRSAVGACVVCRAISTSRGSLVAKLDDVTVHPDWRGRGAGGAMIAALRDHLRSEGMTRIDCGCHRANVGAWRFYERLGFARLGEERLALLL
jgi:ribosomal protein S18 acetylase RimI-like enzyme